MEGFGVLFVCIGNVCRSPMGERLLRLRLPESGFTVTSAGVNAVAGAPMSPEMVVELEARGGSAEGFVARALTDEMVHHADLVLTATRALRSRVLSEVPSALRRTFTVREFAALGDHVHAGTAHDPGDLRALVIRAAAGRSHAQLDDYDILDPIGRPPAVYAEAAHLLDDSVGRIAKILTA